MRSFPSLEDSSKLVFLAIAIKIVKGAEVDGPRGEAGGKRHGVFAQPGEFTEVRVILPRSAVFV